jgi:hypothetical protein
MEEKIQNIISIELKSEGNHKNVFGLDLTNRLILPRKELYYTDADSKNGETLWTVLEEDPGPVGYTVYFDEETEMFGIGMKSSDGLIDIGSHGTFLKALYAM